MAGKLIFVDNITKAIIRQHPDHLFVFGDNMKRRGFGGQAKEMRGEPNAIGIPTKWGPSMDCPSFFCDDDWNYHSVQSAIIKGFIAIESHLLKGGHVVYPLNGIGTGRAQLATKAPLIFKFITDTINLYKEKYGE